MTGRLIRLTLLLALSSPLPAQTPSPYQPHTLTAIPWPDTATGPEDRGFNFTELPLRLGTSRLTLLRRETGWGTCVLVEGFELYDVDRAALSRARTKADSVAAWHKAWDALSYEMDCFEAYATRGDSTNGTAWWVAACLFVADDSLLGYGLLSDTAREAKAYADSFQQKAGYYRFDAGTRAAKKVASLAPSFAQRCREDVHKQRRDKVP